jgi:hypothetical protein
MSKLILKNSINNIALLHKFFTEKGDLNSIKADFFNIIVIKDRLKVVYGLNLRNFRIFLTITYQFKNNILCTTHRVSKGILDASFQARHTLIDISSASFSSFIKSQKSVGSRKKLLSYQKLDRESLQVAYRLSKNIHEKVIF